MFLEGKNNTKKDLISQASFSGGEPGILPKASLRENHRDQISLKQKRSDSHLIFFQRRARDSAEGIPSGEPPRSDIFKTKKIRLSSDLFQRRARDSNPGYP